MKINKHNLEIAKHATAEPLRGKLATDQLHFTKEGTFVANREYCLAVTALSVNSTMDGTGAIAAIAAEMIGEGEVTPCILDPSPGEFPDVARYYEKPVEFSIHLDLDLLRKILGAAEEFGATTIYVDFTAKDEPARIRAFNGDEQRLDVLLMPRSKG